MDKKYKDFPIPSILKGSEQETELREDVNGKYEYKGSVYMNVEGAEFIAISVNKIDKAKDMSEIRYWKIFSSVLRFLHRRDIIFA